MDLGEYEFDDEPCPECGECPTHSRVCDEILCEDGYVDEHDEDPINFAPGQAYTPCDECLGYGILKWCPKCGCDLNRVRQRERNL